MNKDTEVNTCHGNRGARQLGHRVSVCAWWGGGVAKKDV